MKKSILNLAGSILFTGAILTGCNTPAKNLENAKENAKDANKELELANQEYIADLEAYRKESAIRIAANEKSIVEFNARIELEKKEARAEYKQKIADLEKKNSDMKKSMDDYKADGKENWKKFKAEFNHDMDELAKAFKDLTVNNKK